MRPSILLTFADSIELLLKRSGQAISWVYIALIFAIITQIILRRGFHNGMIALEELQWHLYAIGVMFGMVSTQVSDAHVRVDLFHQKMSPKAKHRVEIFGLLFLAMPFIGTVLINSFDFVYESWRVGESSSSQSGLPYRWIIKSVIPASCSLLLLAMFTRLLRSIDGLRNPSTLEEQ